MWQDSFGCANHRIEKLNLLQYVVETDKDSVIIHNYGKHQLQKKGNMKKEVNMRICKGRGGNLKSKFVPNLH